MEKETKQPIEAKQLVDLLLEPVEGGFFYVEPNSLDILVVVPPRGNPSAWWDAKERSGWKRVVQPPK